MSIAIVGQGICCSIGNDAATVYSHLLQQQTGIHFLQEHPKANFTKYPLGAVASSNEALAEKTNLSADMSRTVLLGAYAALQCKSAIPENLYANKRIGFISANTVGGMDITETHFSAIEHKDRSVLPFLKYHESGSSTEIIANHLGITDFFTTISTACSSAANAIILGAKLIAANKLDMVIAGGVDSLTSFTIEGFNSLNILDKNYCKPFDKNRAGLNLGEGAAYLLLVSDKVAAEISTTPLGFLAGYGNANDAFHQTASSPNGTGNFLAMQQALSIAAIDADAIGYINLHGTGTGNNDLAEGVAIKNLFKENIPPLSSTKTYTGHTLAACGAIEAVISLLSLKHNVLFPNLRFNEPIEEHGLLPITSVIEKEVNYVLSNSFGFGGNCSALIFSKEK